MVRRILVYVKSVDHHIPDDVVQVDFPAFESRSIIDIGMEIFIAFKPDEHCFNGDNNMVELDNLIFRENELLFRYI